MTFSITDQTVCRVRNGIDSSAIIAILISEAEASEFTNAIGRDTTRSFSAVSLLETGIVVETPRESEGLARLDLSVAEAEKSKSFRSACMALDRATCLLYLWQPASRSGLELRQLRRIRTMEWKRRTVAFQR